MEILKTLGIDAKIIVSSIISFLLLLWLLGKFLVKPINGVIEERKSEIESSYKRISEDTARVEARQLELDRRLSEIEAEARSKIEEAAAQASRMKDQIVAEARAEAEKVKERGIQEIEREREKALQSIRENVAELVLKAGEKLLSQEMNDARHRELIASTLDDLGNLKN